MKSSTEIEGVTYSWTIPPTTGDVLEYRVWIACIDDPERHTIALFEWVSRWLDNAEEVLHNLSGDYERFLILCELVAQSAELPPEVLTDVGRAGDRQSEIPDGWKPKPACDCPQCRKGIPNPDNTKCMWDGIDPRSEVAAICLMGLQSPDEPYYVTQLRAAYARTEARYAAFQREKREEHSEYKRIMLGESQ